MKKNKLINPLPIKNIGDPYVLFYDGTYYLYATSFFDGFYCWTSEDLAEWSDAKVCYEATERSFGNSCFWAPEVYEFDNKFYMYYTAQWKIFEKENLRIGVAVADAPEGPFLDVFEEKPMFDCGYGCLDAHILKDGNENYLYYSRAGENHFVNGTKISDIHVVKLGKDYASVEGDHKLVSSPRQPWETIQRDVPQYWNEGAFVVKHCGRYYMMYSANYFASSDYGIGFSVADNPMGPFKKDSRNPLMKTNSKISGPGHNSVVKTPDGTYYCVYHAHTDYHHPNEDRQVYISEMQFKDGRILIDYP